MGISGGGKTTETSTALPQVTAAGSTLANTYADQAPKIQGYADQIGSLVPSLLDKYNAGNPAVNAQSNYITSMLGHDPGQNPQLEALLRQSNASVGNQTAASLGSRGLTGGTVANDIVSRNLSQNDTALRYQDYNQQQQLQAQAAGMAPSNAAADVVGISPLLAATGQAASLPLDAATQYAGGIGGLLGSYGTKVTTTPSAGIGGLIGSLGGALINKYSDARLKQDIRRVGQTDGGLPLYAYKYVWGGPVEIGVLAQDVAEMQPGALGGEVNGYMTVNYGEVR